MDKGYVLLSHGCGSRYPWLSFINVPIIQGRLIMKPVKGDVVQFVAIMLNVLIAVPLLTLINLYLYVIRARIILGHWPSPGNPPYPVGSDFQAILVPIGAVASVVSLIGAAIGILWLMLSRRRWVLVSRPVMQRLLVFVVVWVVFFLLFRSCFAVIQGIS